MTDKVCISFDVDLEGGGDGCGIGCQFELIDGDVDGERIAQLKFGVETYQGRRMY